MFKRLALGLVVIIITFGIILIALDILDIREGVGFRLPSSILNTVFIFMMAVLVACIAAKCFVMVSSPETLWLGGAALAFGIGSLFRVWLLDLSGNAIITAENSTAFIAALLHLVGAGTGLAKKRRCDREIKIKSGIILLYYLGILAAIALITLLAVRGVTPSFFIPGEGVTLLGFIVLIIAVIFFLASSFINLKIYIELYQDFYYWYSLGLMLFAFGIFFVSQGAVDTMIASLGRISQYAGGIYFLVAVLGVNRRICVKSQ